ncbi:ty1-copia retrotransposon protein [Cucumis melo var. makuwa]|uniref:Ty1-copia retrotransposon protein n=1 Tax=Cucumis melo var. makuwa TaxID=1194695 RepID=A0A5A7TIP1_CUCMM|nr:ty1-copia retrotransposon protein [Cucumis melo var. makuwa]TYK29316.1 ty1-copia retrotransposon protein [Cucumis melo var. makuwa]
MEMRDTNLINAFKENRGQDKRPIPQVNLAKEDNDVIAAVVEVNLIENKTDWILDTGASRNFCTNRELLHDFKDTIEGECVFMGNSATAGVLRK